MELQKGGAMKKRIGTGVTDCGPPDRPRWCISVTEEGKREDRRKDYAATIEGRIHGKEKRKSLEGGELARILGGQQRG